MGLQTAVALEDPLPRVMFANILSGSMVQENVSEAHPAFAEILKNLISEECHLFYVFSVIDNQP